MIQAILNYYRSYFFFQAEDGIRDRTVTGVQTCALPISLARSSGYGGRAYNAFAGRTVPSARTPRLGTFWRVRAFVRDAMDPEIGRASCRERVGVTVVVGTFIKKKNSDQ